MAQIDISNIINVNISSAPQLLSGDNINVIGILTNETPLKAINGYTIYKNPNSALNDFGINSNTYKMVNTIFSQNLNILAGNGYVVVLPMLDNITVSATSGLETCSDLIVDLFKSVSDGSMSITVDGGAAQVLTGLDFSNVKTLSDIATVISTGLTGVIISVDNENNALIFTSNTTGSTSSILIESDTTGTDLTTLDYLNIAQATIVDGVDSYTGTERLQDAVARTKDLVFYEAIVPAFTATSSEILATAEIVQPLNKLLFVCGDNSFLTTFTTIQSRGYTKTRCLYNGMGQELEFLAGYVSKALSVNFNGSSTANNLHTKAIIGIDADTTIDETLLNTLQSIGVDCYPSMKGLGIIYCSGTNEWCDTVIFINWLKNALETAGFNCLRSVPTKIPQTEQGVSLLVNSYKDVLEQSIRLGYVASGKWNLPFTFGNQELFYNNIEQVGYYIYSEPVANQSQAERDRRQAPLIQIALKLAGAINKSDVLVYINN